MLKSFLFPALGLVADITLIAFRGFPAIIWIIAAVVVFVVCCVWLYTEVKDDTDNQWLPSALAATVPVLIIGFATAS